MRDSTWAIGHRGPEIELPPGGAIEGVNRHAVEHANETRRPVKIFHRCPGVDWTEIREINPWKAPEPAQQLADTLKAVTGDLDAHIERRAGEIAGPYITAAAEQIAEAQQKFNRERQRADDLAAEYRRQIAALERRLDRETTAARRDAQALDRIRALCRHEQEPTDDGWADIDTLWPHQILAAIDQDPAPAATDERVDAVLATIRGWIVNEKPLRDGWHVDAAGLLLGLELAIARAQHPDDRDRAVMLLDTLAGMWLTDEECETDWTASPTTNGE